jgi:hypothetical protein
LWRFTTTNWRRLRKPRGKHRRRRRSTNHPLAAGTSPRQPPKACPEARTMTPGDSRGRSSGTWDQVKAAKKHHGEGTMESEKKRGRERMSGLRHIGMSECRQTVAFRAPQKHPRSPHGDKDHQFASPDLSTSGAANRNGGRSHRKPHRHRHHPPLLPHSHNHQPPIGIIAMGGVGAGGQMLVGGLVVPPSPVSGGDLGQRAQS